LVFSVAKTNTPPFLEKYPAGVLTKYVVLQVQFGTQPKNPAQLNPPRQFTSPPNASAQQLAIEAPAPKLQITPQLVLTTVPQNPAFKKQQNKLVPEEQKLTPPRPPWPQIQELPAVL
jgi:hypothetical protein